jgi:hypothetical protein
MGGKSKSFKMKLKKINYTLNDFTKPGPLLGRLYRIVKATLCPEMSYSFFLDFYLKSKPHSMQITFLQARGVDVGFFTCTYAFQQLLNEKTVVCRVAIGIIEEHQRGNMPFASLCRRIISYKLRHPFRPVYLVAYLANPFVYVAIARYTAEFWPNRNKETPAFILKLKKSILTAGNLGETEVRPFVLLIHFRVRLAHSLIKRILNSGDPDLKYYVKINPEFQNQMGVMTIVPVRWHNIISNIWKAMIVRPMNKFGFQIRLIFEVIKDAWRK